MKISRNKFFSVFALFLLLSMTISIFSLPPVRASTIQPFAYINASPNVIGVGQKDIIVVWLNELASDSSTSADITNGVRFHNYTVVVTAPDGNKSNLFWQPADNTNYTVSDTTSSQATAFVPTQIGVYNLTFIYPGEVIQRSLTANNTYLPASAKTQLTVQQDPVYDQPDSYPLPNEYWARPIESQNTYWYLISSNWLNSVRDRDYGGNINNRFQPDGIAPSTAHVMWSKGIDSSVFNAADRVSSAYSSPYFATQLIMNGMLYYPNSNSASALWTIVDLRTGATQFNYPGTYQPAFGYYFGTDHPNYHGIMEPGTVFTANFARTLSAYQFSTTNGFASSTLTTYPGGVQAVGSKGEYLAISLLNAGNSTNPQWRVQEWNCSKLWSYPTSSGAIPTLAGTNNGNTSAYFDFQTYITDSAGNRSTTIPVNTVPVSVIFNETHYEPWTVYNDTLLCRSGTLPIQGSNATAPFTYFAVALVNQTIGNNINYTAGQIMWTYNYGPDGNIWNSTTSNPTPTGYTLLQGPTDPVSGVWTLVVKETGQWMGFDMYTGAHLWTTAPQTDVSPYGYTAPTTITGATVSVANGKLFTTGNSGIVFCYNIMTGKLLWTYSAPISYVASVTNYPLNIGAIADGKIYLGSYNPSANANDSLLSGSLVRCLYVDNGTEVFTIPSFGSPGGFAISDGYMAYLNYIDFDVYTLGRGVSATTVTASSQILHYGEKVIVKGTVLDMSPGSAIKGTAAISDKDMGAWMAYEFMGTTKPDAAGVEVTVNVIDSNGNQHPIGTAVSDSNGDYSFEWTPDITGDYQLTAVFAGSNGYYPSVGHSNVYVENALPTATPEVTATPSMTQTYLLASTIAIIIALAIAGAILAIILRRRP